jgi:hypothetical protein
VLAVDDAELEQLDDAGVVQAGAQARLADERLDEGRVLGDRGVDALDDAAAGDAARVVDLGAVDDAHSSFAEPLHEPVAPERLDCFGVHPRTSSRARVQHRPLYAAISS